MFLAKCSSNAQLTALPSPGCSLLPSPHPFSNLADNSSSAPTLNRTFEPPPSAHSSLRMRLSPFPHLFGRHDEYGNPLPAHRFETSNPPQPPPFLRSTSYTSEFSTSDSSAYTSSPPTSSPSLADEDSPDSEKEDPIVHSRCEEGSTWMNGIEASFAENLPRDELDYDFNFDNPPAASLRIVIIGTGFGTSFIAHDDLSD